MSRKFRRLIGLTQGTLWIEALMRALWPLFTVSCLLLAFVIAGGFEVFGPLWHRIGLGVAAGSVLGALVYGFWDFKRPRRQLAMARLDASDPMRPLATMSDSLATGGDGVARALWIEHQRRAEASAEALQAAKPDLRLAPRDRWALRLFAVTALGGAILSAGDLTGERLATAVTPGAVVASGDSAIALTPGVEAWAVPPAYTGEETVLLSRRAVTNGPLTLPQGTEITIRATGMTEPPALAAEGLDPPAALVSLGGGLFETTGVLARSGAITVGDTEAPLASWQITMTPDAPPEIESPEPPRAALTRALEVPFVARDDHGVVAAWVTIDLANDAEERMEVDPI
ncbi:MAG: DUF4175 family protein, partial [Pseudomonadota bacterium]